MSREAVDMEHGGRFHMDDRGVRYCDIFPKIEKGDINVSIIEPQAAALWHRHQNQQDYQFVIKGSLKIGMCNLPNMKYSAVGMSDDEIVKIDNRHDEELKRWREIRKLHKLFDWDEFKPEVRWHYLSEKNACLGPLLIPAGLYHGCVNYTNEQAILIYHITNKYDGTDEERMSPYIAQWELDREAK